MYALEPFLQDCENICICCKWEVFSFFFCFFLFVCLNSIRLSVKTCNQCPNLNIFCKIPFPNRKSVSSCQKKIFVARKDTFYAILHSIFPAKYLSHFRTWALTEGYRMVNNHQTLVAESVTFTTPKCYLLPWQPKGGSLKGGSLCRRVDPSGCTCTCCVW